MGKDGSAKGGRDHQEPEVFRLEGVMREEVEKLKTLES
jgi:hypothetical protein